MAHKEEALSKMPRVCSRCDGRGLLRNNHMKDGKYLLSFMPCSCAKGKRIAIERKQKMEGANGQTGN